MNLEPEKPEPCCPGALEPDAPTKTSAPALWPTLAAPRRPPVMPVLLAPGIRLAFLAAQPGQASKTAAAAFTLWPRVLGGVAQVAPTCRFSSESHLRREFGAELCPRELGPVGPSA